MFITKLTKRDWYRVYKYLWIVRLLPAPRLKRFFGVLYLAFLEDIVLCTILFTLPLKLTTPIMILSLIVIEILICLSVPSLIFYKELRRFSPETFITLEHSTSFSTVEQLRKKHPTAYITSEQGIFSLPPGTKWTILIFQDYYLLCATFRQPYAKKYSTLINIVRHDDIIDKKGFFAQLEPICKRMVNYSKIKLHHGK